MFPDGEGIHNRPRTAVSHIQHTLMNADCLNITSTSYKVHVCGRTDASLSACSLLQALKGCLLKHGFPSILQSKGTRNRHSYP